MIFQTITTITGILGIIGFFIEMPVLLYIGALIYMIETLYEFLQGSLNPAATFLTILISVIVSTLCDYNILHGICFGLCIECVLLTFTAIMAMIFYKPNK